MIVGWLLPKRRVLVAVVTLSVLIVSGVIMVQRSGSSTGNERKASNGDSAADTENQRPQDPSPVASVSAERKAVDFRGKVVTESGDPIAEADVRCTGDGARVAPGVSPEVTSTALDGSFAVGADEAIAQCSVTVSARGFVSKRTILRRHVDTTIALHKAICIAGRVLIDEGKPRPAREFSISVETVGDEGSSVETTAFRNGAYVLGEVPLDRPVLITAVVPGVLPQRRSLSPSSSVEHLDFVFGPFESQEVCCVDAITREPVRTSKVVTDAGAVIEVADESGSLVLRVPQNKSGEEPIRFLVRDHDRVYAQMTCEIRVAGRKIEDAIRIPMLRACSIAGQVVNENDKTVARAKVSVDDRGFIFRREDLDPEMPIQEWPDSRVLLRSPQRLHMTFSDGNGEFLIEELVPSKSAMPVTASHASYIDSKVVYVSAGQVSQIKDVRLVLLAGNEVLGRVMMEGKRVDAIVRWQKGSESHSVGTDETGTFRFGAVPSGLVTFQVTLSGFSVGLRSSLDAELRRQVEIRPGDVAHVDFDLPFKFDVISGSVKYSGGAPCPGVQVVAYSKSCGFEKCEATNQDGSYSIVVPDREGNGQPAEYMVEARGGSFQEVIRGVRAGRSDVDFEIEDGEVVSFALKDERSRRPIGGIRAYQWENDSHEQRGRAGWSPCVSNLGSNQFEPDSDGVYSIVARARVDVLSIVPLSSEYPSLSIRCSELRDSVGSPKTILVKTVNHLRVKVSVPGQDADIMSRHVVLVLTPDEASLVRNPTGALIRNRINSVEFRVPSDLGPSLVSERMLVNRSSQGFVAERIPDGTYCLVPFPDDLRFSPETFEVVAQRSDEVTVVVQSR